MSLNSLTNDELRRRSDFRQITVTKDLVPNAAMSNRVATEVALQDNAVAGTLNALTKYIPTEIVTLYVAASSATPAITASVPVFDSTVNYWGCVLITPIILLLVYASKRASTGLRPIPNVKELPWWKMSAATIAFLVWGLAVPGNPYISGESGAVIAGFGAVLISTVLSLLEPIFERPTVPPAG
jgi:hypothetical protein